MKIKTKKWSETLHKSLVHKLWDAQYCDCTYSFCVGGHQMYTHIHMYTFVPFANVDSFVMKTMSSYAMSAWQ